MLRVSDLRISMSIVLSNLVVKFLLLRIISKIGYSKHSELARAKMRAVFIGQMTNTGILLLIVNGDFTYAPWPFNLIPINERFTDFDINWYSIIPKQLETTMLITSVVPWIVLCISFIKRKLKIWRDRGYSLSSQN